MRILQSMDDCGLGGIFLSVISTLVLLCFRQTRRSALFICGMVPVMMIQFLKVQEFGPHHRYLLLPALILPPAMALKLSRSAGFFVRLCSWSAITVFGIASMALTFLPNIEEYREYTRPLFPKASFPPLTRTDLPEFERLAIRVEEVASGTRKGRVAVVASSLTINGTMFKCINRSLAKSLIDPNRVLIGGEVDRINGFPKEFFEADVLVVAVPPQIHTSMEEQQGVVITSQCLMNREDIGKAFEVDSESFHLADGVTVKIFRRVGPMSRDALEGYVSRLRQAHPDCPFFHTPPPSLAESN